MLISALCICAVVCLCTVSMLISFIALPWSHFTLNNVGLATKKRRKDIFFHLERKYRLHVLSKSDYVQIPWPMLICLWLLKHKRSCPRNVSLNLMHRPPIIIFPEHYIAFNKNTLCSEFCLLLSAGLRLFPFAFSFLYYIFFIQNSTSIHFAYLLCMQLFEEEIAQVRLVPAGNAVYVCAWVRNRLIEHSISWERHSKCDTYFEGIFIFDCTQTTFQFGIDFIFTEVVIVQKIFQCIRISDEK